jgi:hypothetical protein
LGRDIPEVSIGVISHLSELLPLVDDQDAFLSYLRHPGVRFVSWRMRLVVSEQLRKCAPFFDRKVLLDCTCELIDDAVASVRNDAVRSVGELMGEEDLWIAEDFAASGNHWTRMCAARLFLVVRQEVAVCGRGLIRRMMGDPVFAVQAAAAVAWERIRPAE